MKKAKDPILREFPGRCRQCYMRSEVCICDLIPDIQNSTFLTVIMHHRETFKTTNTARIACMALQNSRILVRGIRDQVLDLADVHFPERQSVLLTLSDESHVLTPEFVRSFDKPLHLIVPDGNWRQASRVGKREPALQGIPWIKLPPGPKSCYKLRHEHHPEGLSTLEAISRALAIIESPQIDADLMKIFNIMVERTLSTRPPNRIPPPA
jgi:DTW domain-containing protein YfiP